MNYKEIMSQIDKNKARMFMVLLKNDYASSNANEWYQHFSGFVKKNLAAVGVNVETIGSSTADAVVTRMERKSGISL